MRSFSRLLLAGAVALAIPMVGHAESQFVTGTTTPLTATARLDFQITVPKILFLRVGTGADYTTNPAINLIAFTVPAANVGDGTSIAATAASGDLGTGAVTAKVLGNNGTIAFSSTTLGTLNNGVAADVISYNQIATAVAVLNSPVALPHPVLVDNATTSLNIAPVTGKVVNRDARWTFSYLNSNVVAPGVYGGVNANNSRVTYTASMP